MQNKENVSLSYEKTFTEKNSEQLFDILEYAEFTKEGVKYSGPAFVDDTRKDLSDTEKVVYKKENAYLENGFLVLRATESNGVNAGAHIKFKDRKFGNGYIEIKAKLPKTMAGITPKASLCAKKRGCEYSIDFLQVLGIKGKNECSMKSSFATDGKDFSINYLYSQDYSWPTLYPADENLLDEHWHTFGFEKDTEFAVFYVDGNEYCKVDLDTPVFNVFSGESTLEFSLNIGLRETEAPNEETVLPCEMLVEYIKFYERKA